MICLQDTTMKNKIPFYFLLILFFSCSKLQVQQTSISGPHIVLYKFFVHDFDYSDKMVEVKPGSTVDEEVDTFFDPVGVYCDSAIRKFAAAWQTPVLSPTHHFGDKLDEQV